MLVLKTLRPIAVLSCTLALVTPLVPLAGKALATQTAYAATLPEDNAYVKSASADVQTYTAPDYEQLAAISQSAQVDSASDTSSDLSSSDELALAKKNALDAISGKEDTTTSADTPSAPAIKLDTFWATPDSVLKARAERKREKAAAAWETKSRDAIIEDGMKYVDKVPYVFGGETPDGWDCSGYVKYVFGETLNLSLEHSVLAQRAAGKIIDKSDAKPGDLVVFSNKKEDGFHVGIYLGNDQMLNAPSPGKKTKIGNVYWDPDNTVQFVDVLGLAPDVPSAYGWGSDGGKD